MSVTTQKIHEINEVDPKGILIKMYPDLDGENLQIFQLTCQATGLNPYLKQVFPVIRNNNKTGKKMMTIQTSIDGYRLIADRTGKYTPGREPTFTYDKEGKILSATAYIKKLTSDGSWHEVAASAYFDEYAQSFNGKLTNFWENMPHNQLAKCAEALAIRKAFPFETAHVYTKEEMQNTKMSQVMDEVNVETGEIHAEEVKYISEAQLKKFYAMTHDYPKYIDMVKRKYGEPKLMPASGFNDFIAHFEEWIKNNPPQPKKEMPPKDNGPQVEDFSSAEIAF